MLFHGTDQTPGFFPRFYQHLTGMLPIRPGKQGLTQGVFRLLQDRIGQRLQGGTAIGFHEIHHLSCHDGGTTDIGVNIADHLIGHPHIQADQIHEILIDHTGFHQFYDRKPQPLVINLRRGGGKAHPPDIGQMADAHRIADQITLQINRSHHRDIIHMTGAKHRIIGDNDIACFQAFRWDFVQHMAQGG